MSVLKWIQQSLFGSTDSIATPVQAIPKLEPTLEKTETPASAPPSIEGPSDVWSIALLCSPKPIELQFAQRGSSTWSLHWRGMEALTLRLPPTLKSPPLDVAQSLVSWALLVSRRRRTQQNKLEKKKLETQIRDYLDQSLRLDPQWKKREARKSKRRLQNLQAQGKFHDLKACFAAINQEYFENALAAEVTWSRKLGGLSTHCQKLRPDGSTYHLITISQGYDAEDVTPEILGGVMYHECLHIVYPPEMVNQRRVVHGRAFKSAERRYRHFENWMHWHRHGLPQSLRRIRRQGREKKAK